MACGNVESVPDLVRKRKLKCRYCRKPELCRVLETWLDLLQPWNTQRGWCLNEAPWTRPPLVVSLGPERLSHQDIHLQQILTCKSFSPILTFSALWLHSSFDLLTPSHLTSSWKKCHLSYFYINSLSPYGDCRAFMEIFGNKWMSQSQGGKEILESWRYLALVLCPVLLNAIAWVPHYMAQSKILEWTQRAQIYHTADRQKKSWEQLTATRHSPVSPMCLHAFLV